MPDIVNYLKNNLATGFIGRELHYLPVASSTQDMARDLAEQGAPEGTAVIAGRQQSGRGRLGRTWLSPEGGLATSVVLHPAMPAVHLLPAISALAVLRTVRGLGIGAGIKWPNDVLINGRKVCGILIEHGLAGGIVSYSIIGIGININFDTGLYPEIAGFATSLSLQLGHELPVGRVALSVYTELEALYLQAEKPAAIISEWAASMDTLGRRVKVQSGNSTVEGVAETISGSGHLLLRMDDGSLHEILAGDVSLTPGNSQ